MAITREQALCLLFCEEINEDNISRLTQRINSMKDIDICYEKDPLQPVLLPIVRINANQFTYRRYSSEALKSKKNPKKEYTQLTSDTQIIRFLNDLYLPFDPCNEVIYEQRDVTMKDVLSSLWKHTDKFDNKTISSFVSWCSKSRFPFMQVESSRKLLKNNHMKRIRYRKLYVVKDEFKNDIANGIREYIPKFQQYIKGLKLDGYEVIGYVRKSYGNEDKETRIRLLQSMIDKMFERLLVDKIFVSPMSHAGEPFSSRDVKCDKAILKELDKAEGTTQDLISYFSIEKKVCLVGVDFAGITTNSDDLRSLLSKNESIKKIIVDRSPFGKSISIYDRDNLLDGTEDINKFDCRKGLLQRSK